MHFKLLFSYSASAKINSVSDSVSQNYCPILCRLWTKVHKIWQVCKGFIAVCNLQSFQLFLFSDSDSLLLRCDASVNGILLLEHMHMDSPQ